MSTQSYTATEQDITDTKNAREEHVRSSNVELVSTARVVGGGVSTDNGTDNSGGVRRVVGGVSDLADSLPVTGFMSKGNQVVPLSKVTADTLCTLPGSGMQVDVAFAIENGFLPPEFLDNPLKVAGELAAQQKAEQEAKANERVDLNNADAVADRLMHASIDGYDAQVEAVADAYLADIDPTTAELDFAGMGRAMGATEKGARVAFENVWNSKREAVEAAIADRVNDMDGFRRWFATEQPGRFKAAVKAVALDSRDVSAWRSAANEYAALHAHSGNVNPDDVLADFKAGKFGSSVVDAIQGKNGTVLLEFRDGQIMDSRAALKHGLIKAGGR